MKYIKLVFKMMVFFCLVDFALLLLLLNAKSAKTGSLLADQRLKINGKTGNEFSRRVRRAGGAVATAAVAARRSSARENTAGQFGQQLRAK